MMASEPSSFALRNWLKRQFLADMHDTTETARTPLRIHKIMSKMISGTANSRRGGCGAGDSKSEQQTAVEAWNE